VATLDRGIWAVGPPRPDYFARRADGTGVVIDVRADERIGEQDAAVFAATGRLSAPVGWEYQWVGELGVVHAANLRWLSGYRHLAVPRRDSVRAFGRSCLTPDKTMPRRFTDLAGHRTCWHT